MIQKIAHLADIHLRKTPTRNDEYLKVFQRLISSLKKEKPDRIVIVGDLVNDYLDLQGEQLILAHNLLDELSLIAPVRITRGNHDCRKKNLKRVDSIKAIVKTMGGRDVQYYEHTGFFEDDNVMWAVWHHGQNKNNPWKTKDGKKILAYQDTSDYTIIDLFHDPVTGCMSVTNFEMKSKSYYKLSDFKGEYSFMGDIHRMQYLDKDNKKAYCGSLIAQDFGEGDDNFHGYLLWDISTGDVKEIPIKNDYSFKNIMLSPYTDFDDLDIDIDDPTKFMKVRFIWGTLPQTRNNDNERKVVEHIKSKYKNIVTSHKNEFVENEDVEVNEDITVENITDDAVQHEIFREYLEKIGADKQVIDDVIALDGEVLKEIEILNINSIEWNIIKFGGTNFMSYENIDIDWRELDGLFQITGDNTAGKTTIMKLITYILFGKTLETDTRMKYGDMRFVNNRNAATYCDGYIVIEANGEYYGIKKRTTITKNRKNEITGAPTVMSYYVLNNPDDEMTDENAVEKLDGDQKNDTQKKINEIIGSYDNFMRVVMTTSDTLNKVLSNDMAVFIDSLLYDSGLDIFDKKLEGWKVINKRNNEKSRINCNVEMTKNLNNTLNLEIDALRGEVNIMENVRYPDLKNRINTGREYQESLMKKLYKIDPEIYSLDVEDVRESIKLHEKSVAELRDRETVLNKSIVSLRETYDEARLVELTQKRDEHKQRVYEKKLEIKEEDRNKSDYEHRIEIINGKIFTLKKDGTTKKNEITKLKESKTCPTCGQALDEKHQEHINENIKKIEIDMYAVAKEIKSHQNDIDTDWKPLIKKCDENKERINQEIVTMDLEMESILAEIGELNNHKNDVESRAKFQTELDTIPTKIKNEELQITIYEQKITNHENSQKQIVENQKIEKGIEAAKAKIETLNEELNELKEDIFIRKTSIAEKQQKIKENEILIAEFTLQEHQDNVMALYKKCVHRDGIPKQMLSSYIIPKINKTLEDILSVAPFKVWLDVDEIRPKLAYNDRPNSVIDCISASGKERTFSSVVLKFGLNQINIKAKPTIFLLDEVMGKLDENSVDEFKEILQVIKLKMKKILVIEHNHEINPDYLIDVKLNDRGISNVILD